IVFVRCIYKALGCCYELVETSGLIFVLSAFDDSDAISNNWSSTCRQRIGDWKVLLFFGETHVGHIPQADQAFTPGEFLHQQRSIGSVLVDVCIELAQPLVA